MARKRVWPDGEFERWYRSSPAGDEPLQAERWPTKTVVIVALTAAAAGLLALACRMRNGLATRNG